MSTKKLDIVLGAQTLTAWNTGSTGEEFLIVGMEGWEDGVEIRRNSTTTLWGHGEVQSTNALFEARHLDISIMRTGTPQQLLAFRNMIVNALQDPNTRRQITLTEYAGGAKIHRERLLARFEDDGLGWTQIGNSATATLYFVCPNPVKTVWLNGSSTPVTGGRI